MTQAGQDFSMWQGENKKLLVQVLDCNDDPVNLTTISDLEWVMQTGFYLVDPKVIKKLGTGIEITDALDGRFEVELDPGDTEELAGFLQHEARLVDMDGNKYTVMIGRAKIEVSITNASP